MSRMNQVMQIGNIEGDIHYYIEDYAYTYLKKQKGKEKTKYFLYGEKEESNQQKKLYIYGIAEKPKMEQTYFKEYYPLGFLKVKNDETFWITLKGQEQKINGFYVFYAPNQAMQEYLVDHREEEKQDKPEDKAKRQLAGETLPMKETLVPARKIKKAKNKNEFKNEKFIFPIGGILVACLILLVLTSANGRKKIEIFKQVISQTVSDATGKSTEGDFIIEEKNIVQEEAVNNYVEQQDSLGENDIERESEENNSGMVAENKEASMEASEKENDTEKDKIEYASAQTLEEDSKDASKVEIKETLEQNTENSYEEYIVKNGDTLVAICKTKYGSLIKMEEICTINNIKNADYIAPGQKLYLP